MGAPRILLAGGDDAAHRALVELGYEVGTIPPAAVELADRLSPFRTFSDGLLHLIANPLTVIITNGAVIEEDLAALRDGLGAVDVELLITAQAEVTAAAAQIQAVVRSLASS